MNVALLHTKDALEPPVDPVLENIEQALAANDHECRRITVDDSVLDTLEKPSPTSVRLRATCVIQASSC